MAAAGSGRLVVVGTPIGNLGDLSPRAAEALASADVLACEDTRRTGRLLDLAGIAAPRLVRVDEHTEAGAVTGLLERIRAGETVVVASDAGLPALSDPGGRLVAAARDEGLAVEVIPGPFAGAVAAVASGLLDGSGRFTFEGFLPRKGPHRRRRLALVAADERPVVIYEAPHRLAHTLADLAEVAGADRAVALCRELTKMHEEVWRGTLAEAASGAAASAPRGEHVIVLAAAPAPQEPSDEEVLACIEHHLEAGATRRDAAGAAAAELGVAPNRVKRLAAGRGP